MSDSMQYSNRKLSDEAKKLETAGQFDQAAELYKQSYDSYPGSFVASHYIKCLRKLGKSAEAVKFGRQLSRQLQDDPYVHKELSWAIYDVYLKKSERTGDNEVDDLEHEKQSNPNFQKMLAVANYILSKASATEDILRTRTIFAICNEAKQRGNWQVMYDFASQLDPERLLAEQKELYGQKKMSDHQEWLCKVVKPLFELKRYEECIDFAHKGIEKYPREKLFPWWQACSKKALGQVEEALRELEQIDARFHKEWYIQRDIADGYLQLQQYDEAWIWFCKAASSSRLEDLKGRFKMFQQMSMLLEQRGRWQEAHDHLQLACAIVEREHWEHPTEALSSQLFQFRKRHMEHITFPADTPPDMLSTLFRKCRTLWQETIRSTRINRKGCIKKVYEENGYGYIRADNVDIHFRFRDVIRGVIPVEGMEVEFETEKSFDEKYQKDSTKAVNIRPVRSSV